MNIVILDQSRLQRRIAIFPKTYAKTYAGFGRKKIPLANRPRGSVIRRNGPAQGGEAGGLRPGQILSTCLHSLLTSIKRGLQRGFN